MSGRDGATRRRIGFGRRALIAGLVTSLLGLAGIGGVGPDSTPAGAAEVPRNGLSAETAAPSCWSVKQSYPASADGTYWLWTPKLVEPQQFYCDMTTDGGGWVLIGRGREGWSFPYWGQGSPSTVRSPITGTAAFTPASLPTPTVDGLLNGGRMDGLTDGIRLRRATNATGTTWQEVRMRVKTFGAWSWAFGGGIYLSSVKFDNTTTNLATSTYRTNTTANVQVANDTRRVFTYPLAAHNLRSGFSFGSSVTTGSASATSYLWEFANENNAIPFTQVFVRPMISEADIVDDGVSVAPSSGLPGSTVDPMLDRRPVPQPWGTTGINLGTANPDLSANVLAFADIGNTIYIGGKFLQLQRGPTATPITQSYLAAFDKTTGERIESFNPVIDAPVWELKAAPDGSKLFVGGEFTNVNGVANTGGLAALDPATGAPVASWVGYISRTTGTADVRAMDIQNGYLYVGGQFNGVAGGVGAQFTGPIVVGRLARLRVSDGRPDGGWKPNIETAPQDLDVSAQGDRVYAVGLFQTLNGVTLNPTKLAIMNTTNGDAVSGLEPWQPNATSSEWVNAILEVGSKVYQGGTQHILHQYARSDYELERSHLTKTGGDFQAIAFRDGILYASCHCTDWQYQDSNTWSDPINYSRVNAINLVGAYDTTNDLEVVPEFHPTQIDLVGDGGEGPWELFVDSDNCMWAGGDLMRLGTTATPFYGGYERFCGRDATAPTVPANSKATLNGNDVTLTWNASTDNATAPIRYQILKDDPTFGTMVMGTTFERTFTDTNVVDSSRYFIRTVDDEGNRSATTSALSVTPPPPAVATLLAHGATWSYQADGQDLGASIHSSSVNTSSWATGASQLGWGGKGENTVIPSNPVTSYYVRRVNIANPAQYKTISVRLKRDDGAVVYVNGVPVVRDNMPDGPILASTLASSYTSGAAESTWFEYQVPASLFVAGQNTIAAEVHQADANNADGIFDLELVARNSIETTPPSKPTPKVDDVSFGSVALSWTASTDNRAVVGYLVRRNGTPVAFTQGTNVTDIGLAPTTAYTYQVVAVDSSGNLGSAGSVVGTTTANNVLVQSGATWSYRSTATDPGTAWRLPSFDASAWTEGRSQLGWGNRGEATVVPSGTLTQYYVRRVNVTNAAAVGQLTLRVKRDDGIAVYLNGTEILRDNLPAGPLTADTHPIDVVSAADGIAWKTFTLPSSALVSGDNVLAAEVHQDSKTDTRAVFDLELTTGTTDITPPTAVMTFPSNNASYRSNGWIAGCTATTDICGTAGDYGSGLASVRLTIQRSNNQQYWTGSAWQKASATITATGTTSWGAALPSTKLAHGVTYTVTAWSVDQAGQSSAPRVRTFTYDTVGPIAGGITTTNKSGAINTNSDTFAVTFDEPLKPSSVPAASALTLVRSNGATLYGISGLTNGFVTTGGTGYLGSSPTMRVVAYAGTLALSNGNRTVTFKVTGPCTGACTARTTAKVSGAFQFIAATTLRDAANNQPKVATVTAAKQVLF